jgi:hypothetical protein
MRFFRRITVPRLAIETRSVPALARSYPRDFALITRTAPCLRQLPSCVAVYSRDARSGRVDAPLAELRTATPRGLTVHPSASQPDVFYVADPISAIQLRSLFPMLKQNCIYT